MSMSGIIISLLYSFGGVILLIEICACQEDNSIEKGGGDREILRTKSCFKQFNTFQGCLCEISDGQIVLNGVKSEGFTIAFCTQFIVTVQGKTMKYRRDYIDFVCNIPNLNMIMVKLKTGELLFHINNPLYIEIEEKVKEIRKNKFPFLFQFNSTKYYRNETDTSRKNVAEERKQEVSTLRKLFPMCLALFIGFIIGFFLGKVFRFSRNAISNKSDKNGDFESGYRTLNRSYKQEISHSDSDDRNGDFECRHRKNNKSYKKGNAQSHSGDGDGDFEFGHRINDNSALVKNPKSDSGDKLRDFEFENRIRNYLFYLSQSDCDGKYRDLEGRINDYLLYNSQSNYGDENRNLAFGYRLIDYLFYDLQSDSGDKNRDFEFRHRKNDKSYEQGSSQSDCADEDGDFDSGYLTNNTSFIQGSSQSNSRGKNGDSESRHRINDNSPLVKRVAKANCDTNRDNRQIT